MGVTIDMNDCDGKDKIKRKLTRVQKCSCALARLCLGNGFHSSHRSIYMDACVDVSVCMYLCTVCVLV